MRRPGSEDPHRRERNLINFLCMIVSIQHKTVFCSLVFFTILVHSLFLILFHIPFSYSDPYSLQDSISYSVLCSVPYSIPYSVPYSVLYSILIIFYSLYYVFLNQK